MNKPSDEKGTITSGLPNEQLEASELTDKQLDLATGGVSKGLIGASDKVSLGIKVSDESPKETVTFEYGGLAIQYTTQKPD